MAEPIQIDIKVLAQWLIEHDWEFQNICKQLKTGMSYSDEKIKKLSDDTRDKFIVPILKAYDTNHDSSLNAEEARRYNEFKQKNNSANPLLIDMRLYGLSPKPPSTIPGL